MRHLVVALALLSSCDSCLPESWRVPEKRKVEIRLIELHQECIQDNPCTEVHRCHAESEARCLDAGYEKECGNGERESSCGANIK